MNHLRFSIRKSAITSRTRRLTMHNSVVDSTIDVFGVTEVDDVTISGQSSAGCLNWKNEVGIAEMNFVFRHADLLEKDSFAHSN